MNAEPRDGRLEVLIAQRETLIETLRTDPQGQDFCRALTAIVDQVVRALVDQEDHFPFAVIATGGYGRQELAPYSDVDLTVVPDGAPSERADDALRTLFRRLDDVVRGRLGLEVGYAYRLVSDVPGLDAVTLAGLLDARLLAGAAGPFRALRSAVEAQHQAGDFLLAKVRERHEAMRKFGESPLVAEPDLKEGAGGLRCFHAANWIRSVLGEIPARPSEAYEGVLKTRNLLHAVVGRRTDRLSRPRQAEISDAEGVPWSEWSARAARDRTALHDLYRDTERRIRHSSFQVVPGVRCVRGELRVEAGASAGRAAAGIAIATALGVEVSDLLPPFSGEVGGPQAMYALSTGEATLRNLDRTGVLAALVPEIAACRYLVPPETMHAYTVLEHTFRTIRHLDEAENHPVWRELRGGIQDAEPLYLAALMHDAGKAVELERHAEIGAELCQAVGVRWGLEDSIVRTAAWLVHEHLSMSKTVRMRDLMHPATIQEFADLVGDENRLRALTLLTLADIQAVGPNSLSEAQEAQIRLLYERTLESLAGEIALDDSGHRRRAVRALERQQVPEEDIQKFVDSLPAYYLASAGPEEIRVHYALARRAAAGEAEVIFSSDARQASSEILVCAPDSPGLLSRILAVLYAYELSVSGIRALTTRSQPPIAVDVLQVSYNGRAVPLATEVRCREDLLAVVEGRRSSTELLRERGKDPDRRQEFFSTIVTPGSPTILEFRSPRGRGMPYRFSKLIAECGWNVVAARVGQWAGEGAAAFYVTHHDGRPVSPEEIERGLGRRVAPG